jgi:hypothetical protein
VTAMTYKLNDAQADRYFVFGHRRAAGAERHIATSGPRYGTVGEALQAALEWAERHPSEEVIVIARIDCVELREIKTTISRTTARP